EEAGADHPVRASLGDEGAIGDPPQEPRRDAIVEMRHVDLVDVRIWPPRLVGVTYGDPRHALRRVFPRVFMPCALGLVVGDRHDDAPRFSKAYARVSAADSRPRGSRRKDARIEGALLAALDDGRRPAGPSFE